LSLSPIFGLADGVSPVFVLAFVFVSLTFVFVFMVPLALSVPEPMLGLALGLVVASCVEEVDWLPEPTLVDDDWLVDVDRSPEPTLLLEFWVPVPRFVGGLTLVFGLIVTLPLGVLSEPLPVPSLPELWAIAGPIPIISAATDPATNGCT
jgi:hypothetical protein